ncbi:hypothetical protein Gotri_018793, partial [Gossypium trilobum]|nr:hypothetical protein [Gossypium trilobum]
SNNFIRRVLQRVFNASKRASDFTLNSQGQPWVEVYVKVSTYGPYAVMDRSITGESVGTIEDVGGFPVGQRLLRCSKDDALFGVDFCIHVHDLLAGLISKGMTKQFDDFLGQFLDYDAKSISMDYRSYIRIRVRIDVRNPLKRRKKIVLVKIKAFPKQAMVASSCWLFEKGEGQLLGDLRKAFGREEEGGQMNR